MTISIEIHEQFGKPHVIKVGGRLDTNTAGTFAQQVAPVMAHTPNGIVLDLEDLEFISSAGIREVIIISKNLRSQNASFAITRLQPQVQKVFEIIQALPNMSIFSDDQNLDNYLAAIQKKERNRRR